MNSDPEKRMRMLREFGEMFPKAGEEVSKFVNGHSYIKERSTKTTGCPICLDFLKQGQKITALPCRHIFHGPCIQSWLK